MGLSENTRIILIRFLIFSIYCLFGAAVFQALEQHHHKQLPKSSLYILQENLLLKYNISQKDFEAIVETVSLEFSERRHNDWNYPNSLFFVVIVLTTIGMHHFQLYC